MCSHQPRSCARCGKELDPLRQRHNKYCSVACAGRATRRRVEHPCEFCGESTINRRFCSNRCATDFKRAEIASRFEAGDVAGAYPRTMKGYLLDTRGRRCEICGLEAWMGESIPMIMDHVDGDSTNNALANLRLVCPNCDAQLPTFKNRNRGRGRAYRRERYAAGKSF